MCEGLILRGVILLMIGLVALALSCCLALERKRFLETAQRAPGEVVARNAGGAHPEIRFVDHAGEVISYPQGGLIWGYREGMQVEVLYEPNHPRRSAVVRDAGALWGVPALFGAVGGVLILGGICALRQVETD